MSRTRRSILTAAIIVAAAGAIGPAASETRRELPAGFTYLPEIGEANVFEKYEEGARRGVHSITAAEAGIIRKPIDLPLTEETEIEFDWRYVTLPAQGAETSAATHDYHSIAVEFDNGQDITYYWSSELPVGTGFRCPIPTWTGRETHVVARSGTEGLGQWFNEERDVYRDYGEKIGGTLPAKIVRVWLIAVSLFQHTEGKCQYADISFVTVDGVVPVL